MKKQRNGKIKINKSYFIGQIKNYKQMIMAFASHQMIDIFFFHLEWVLKMIEVNKITLSLILLSLKRCVKVLTTLKEKLKGMMNTGKIITSKQKE